MIRHDRRRHQRPMRRSDFWRQVLVAVVASVLFGLVTNAAQYALASSRVDDLRRYWREWSQGATREITTLHAQVRAPHG